MTNLLLIIDGYTGVHLPFFFDIIYLFVIKDEVIKKDYKYLCCSCSKKLMNWIDITSVYFPEMKINIV